jgi:hypothetical protein
VYFTDYDEDSVMLYFFPAKWDKNGKGTKANTRISQKDYEHALEMYPPKQ